MLKKSLIITTILGWTVLGGCSIKRNADEQIDTTSETTVTTDTTPAPMMDYLPQNVTRLITQSKTVILYFYKEDCSECTKFEKSLSENATSIPSNFMIVKADAQIWTGLAQQYNITTQPTIVRIDGSLKQVNTIENPSFEEFLEIIK